MTTILDGGRPGDQRGFLHKKIGRFIGGVAKTLIPAVGVGADIFDTAKGFFGRPAVQPFPATFIPGGGTGIPGLPFHNGGNGAKPCPPPLKRNPATGNCIFPKSPRGAEVFGGNVIDGQYGAGYVAGSRIVDVAQCPRGTVLGKDGICYANLANKNRLYPRGRRPLLTGGDMRAISRARTAGNRLANAKSDLIAIGMLKAAGPRKRRKKTVPC